MEAAQHGFKHFGFGLSVESKVEAGGEGHYQTSVLALQIVLWAHFLQLYNDRKP